MCASPSCWLVAPIVQPTMMTVMTQTTMMASMTTTMIIFIGNNRGCASDTRELELDDRRLPAQVKHSHTQNRVARMRAFKALAHMHMHDQRVRVCYDNRCVMRAHCAFAMRSRANDMRIRYEAQSDTMRFFRVVRGRWQACHIPRIYQSVMAIIAN